MGLHCFLTQACALRVEALATRRNLVAVPLDCVRIVRGIVQGNRPKVVRAFWNIYGWCIYAIGVRG